MKELMEGDREQIINAVIDGRNSEYWRILKIELNRMLERENTYLDGFKKSGIRPDGIEVDNYNRSKDRFRDIQRFLAINETIVNHNLTALQKMRAKVTEVASTVNSFVRSWNESPVKEGKSTGGN